MIEDKNQEHTSLSSLGEFGLINHLTKQFNIKNDSTLTGIGDDSAILDFKNKSVVLTTDLLLDVQLPLSSGFETALKNIGSFSNRGFELTVNSVNIENSSFKWRSDFTFSFNVLAVFVPLLSLCFSYYSF